MANMNKVAGSELNNTAISLEVLKSVDVSDMVIFLDEFGNLSLFKVDSRVATRGAKGGTALKLSDMVGDAVLSLPTTNALPDGVVMVRKVLAGVNVRTLRKLAPKVDTAVAVTDAPSDIAAAPTSEPVVAASEPVSEPVAEVSEPAIPAVDLIESAPAAAVSEPVIDFAQCGPEDDISALIAEVITLSNLIAQ